MAEEPEPMQRLRASLHGSWTILNVTAVHTSSCMGPQHLGVRIQRDKEKVEIASLKTEGGKVVLGRARQLSTKELTALIDAAIAHYLSARNTVSVREMIAEKVSHLSSPEERLKEMARLTVDQSTDTLGIAIWFDNLLIDPRFKNDFGQTEVSNFMAWIAGLPAGAKNSK